MSITVTPEDRITVVQNKNEKEEIVKTNQAATSVTGTNTEIASQAPVSVEEYNAVAIALQRARDKETKTKETYITRSSGLINPVKSVTTSTYVRTQSTSATSVANTLYPDPESIKPTGQQTDLYNRFVDTNPNSLTGATIAAIEATNQYNAAVENQDIGNTIKQYILQVDSGNVGVVYNGYTTLTVIDERLSQDIPESERNELLSLRSNIENIDLTIQSDTDIALRAPGFISAKDAAILEESNRSELETAIRDLNTKPGADEAKANLDAANRAVVDSVRQDQPEVDARSTGDPDARALRTTNKVLVDSFSGNEQSPFYLQLPTLKAITDFRLKNGFNPYGQINPSEIARDAVHFNIFKGALGKTKQVDVPGTKLKTLIMEGLSESTIGSFTIYPNNPDWLSMTHSHNYSDENPISSLVNPALQLLDTVTNISKAISTVAGESASARVSRRVDFIDQYQNTEKLSFNIPFVLFTKSNFISDIYVPLMFLTALSYPTRVFDSKNDIANFARTGVDLLDEGIEKGGQIVTSTENFLNKNANIGAFRYVIAERPEYLSVRHASGLFFFKLAAITNFSYTYKGPWINSRGDIVPDAIGRNQFKQTLANITKRNSQRSKMPYAFPSIAECTLTIKCVEPLFRNDWLDLLSGASDSSGEGIVRVSESRTGTLNNQDTEFVNLNTLRTNVTSNKPAARAQNTPKK